MKARMSGPVTVEELVDRLDSVPEHEIESVLDRMASDGWLERRDNGYHLVRPPRDRTP
jgi:predicted transcriptional regulator of viral defense system